MKVNVLWENGTDGERLPVELEEVPTGNFELPDSCFSGWALVVSYTQTVGQEETFDTKLKKTIIDVFPTQGEALELEKELLESVGDSSSFFTFMDIRYPKTWNMGANSLGKTFVFELYVL